MTADNAWKQHPWVNNLSHDKDGQPMPGQSDPELVFNKLFKGLNNASYRNTMSSVLDDVCDSSKALMRKASNNDKQVLEQYFQSIRELEGRIQQSKSNVDAERQKRVSQIKPLAAVDNLSDRIKAMLDLLALAFWTDSTRVATFMMANTNSRCTYDFIGVK